MNSLVVLAFLLGAASAFDFSAYDVLACSLLTEPPITRHVDASEPEVVGTPGFNFSDPASVYPPNTQCNWHFNTSGQELQIRFFNLSIEDSAGCANDWVKVYDGPDDSSTGFITVCGDVGITDPFIATGQDMFVSFWSGDDAVQGVGFMARAGYPIEVTACDAATSPQEFTAPSGIFATENYPVNYANAARCAYLFTAPAGQVIEIGFNNVDIEECCTCDYIAAYGGNSIAAPKLSHWYGTGRACQLRTSTNQLYLTFQSDFSVTGAGFLGYYRFITPS